MPPTSSSSQRDRVPVAICITAHNEEENLPGCLESVIERAAQVVVLDAESSDRTTEVAKDYRRRVPGVITLLREPNTLWYNVNKTKSFEAATQPWIFYLDADERLTEPLWDEIAEAVSRDAYEGYAVGRKNYFLGRWMRYGGMYPERQPRLFRRGKGSYSLDHVHESLKIEGRVGVLEAPFDHYSYRTVAEFLRKFDTYTGLQAELWYGHGLRWSPGNHLVYGVARPIARFLTQYVRRLGMLDGFPGFFMAWMAGLGEFVAYCKLYDVSQEK